MAETSPAVSRAFHPDKQFLAEPYRTERWFRDLTDRRIRRGAFKSVPQLIRAMVNHIGEHNEHPNSFVWTAKVDDILAKVARAKAVLDKISSD